MVPIKLIEKNLTQSKWGYTLFALVGLGLLLPLVISIIDLIANLDLPALNRSFAYILTRSIVFGVGQAFLSAAIACILGAVIGLLLSSRLHPQSKWIGLFRSSAMVLFVLPGSVIATISLGLLENTKLITLLPAFLKIVFAHTIWSAFFIAGQISLRCIQHLSQQHGRNQFYYAHQAGLSRPKAAWETLKSSVFLELRKWFPLVFCWSLTSFSTVLIIGNGPAHSTPEVLLYFTLTNDASPARVFVLMLLNLLLQMWIFKKLFFEKPDSNTPELQLESATSLPSPALFPEALKPIRNLFTLMPVGLLLWYFAPLAWGLLKSDSLLLESGQMTAIIEAAGHSLLLAFSSCVFLFLMCLLLIRTNDDWRKPLVLIMGISPILLSGAWSTLGLFQALWERPVLSVFFVAFLLALFQLPLATLWIREEQNHLSRRPLQTALSLGMPPTRAFREFFLPALMPVLRKILFFNFVLCLGELALSSFWLVRTPLLATWTHKLNSSFQFEEARSLVLITLMLALAAYLILFRLTDRRKRA